MIAVGFSLIAAPDKDLRGEHNVGTDTKFFEGSKAGWPGDISLDTWRIRRTQLRQQILTAAGIDSLSRKRKPPTAEVFGRKSFDGFTVEKVLIETLPGYWLGGNIFRPAKSGTARHPAILSPHGHWRNGRMEQTDEANVPARAVMLARMGFVVLTYDMVGYNDTKQTPHSFGNDAEKLWNWGPLGLQLWNSIRAVDFVSTLPDVDAARIGATGASGGATQTFLLSAVDDRIRWSVPVNMISGIMQGGSPCENAPGLRVGTFNVEIGAMMAPRPMLMVSATGDWTKNSPKQEFPAVQRIYALYGKATEVESVQLDAPHNYNQATREIVYDFFARKALGLEKGPKESDIPKFEKEDLLALTDRSLPAGARDYAGVFAAFRSTTEIPLSNDDRRRRLRSALLIEWPDEVQEAAGNGNVVLSRPGKGDRIVLRWAGASTGPVVLVAHPDGIDAAEKSAETKALKDQGRRILIASLYRADHKEAPGEGSRYFHTFQRSAASERAQDILTILKWLETKRISPSLLGLEEASIWTAVASAAAPSRRKILAMPVRFSGSDEEWLKSFNAPGIQWAGGWNGILQLLR